MIPRISRKEEHQRLRIKIVEVCFALFLAMIFLRAYSLHLMHDPKLDKWARREYEKFVSLSPQRGEIFDCRGKSLASSVSVKSLYANPRIIEDRATLARRLSQIIGLSEQSIIKKLESEKYFVWLKRKVNPEVYKKIESMSIEGIGAVEESKRFYPNVELASSIIGFTGVDSNGLSGIELQYEKYLRSEESKYTALRDALGRTLFTDGFFVKEFVRGSNVYLTLDQTIQYISETELDKEMARSRASKGYVVVMEPQTGKILAMVSRPQFNPNNYKNSNPDAFLNGAVSLAYEPGSTLKVFIIGAALEEGLINPNDLFYCDKESLTVAGKSIKDSSNKKWLTPSSIIKYSSNIGAAKIALLLGKQRLYKWVKSFGFGEPSGIDLPGEAKGLLRHYTKWSNLDVATIGFGQGIGSSPLQLVTALSIIANGGLKVKPFVVEKVVDQEGKVVFENRPKLGPRVISSSTAEAIRSYMVGVTDKDGTGAKARLNGFTVAGKTGTAQKVDPSTGEYTFEKMVGSFMGFVPAFDPKIAVLVVIDEPKGSVYGGEIAAPVFKRIAERTLEYFQILPSKDIDLELAENFPVINEGAADSEVLLVSDSSGDDVFSEGAVPAFEGFSIREVLRIAERKNLSISIKGTGVAFKQIPVAGTKIGRETRCTVYFRPI